MGPLPPLPKLVRPPIAFCLALAALALPVSARANIGPRWWGDINREPTGLEGVAITDEQLTLDLRPLADVQPVRVEAVYHLYNAGPARHADLLFVSGTAIVKDFEVRLGGRPVDSHMLSSEEFWRHKKEWPPDWMPPHNLPGFGQPDTYSRFQYEQDEARLLAFSVELPAGAATLSARYRARASGTDEHCPIVTWQFPYVLAPAKRWGGFGRLDVTAYLPEGWQSASTPTLEREGDVLRGRFDGLPADVLVVTARAPEGPGLRRALVLYGAVYALAVLAGGLLCWGVGHGYGRLHAHSGGIWAQVSLRLLAGLLAVVWAGLLYGAARLAVVGIFASLRGQESPYFRFGELFDLPGCGNILLMLAVLPAGFLLTLAAARRSVVRAGG